MKNTKKFLLCSAALFMSVGLAACSNKTASSNKPATTQSEKSNNIVGTYKSVKGKDKYALKFNADGTGRKADNAKANGKVDEKFTWKKKSKNLFTVKLKDHGKSGNYTAKFNKSGNLILSNGDKDSRVIYKKVKNLDIDKFIGDSDDDVFAPAKKDNSTSSTRSSNIQKASSIPGDDGVFNMPADMQGTWYSIGKDSDGNDKLTTLIIENNRITFKTEGEEDGGAILHKMQANFDMDKYQQDQTYLQKTQNWGRVTQINENGHNMINVRGWLQGAGDGSYYYLTQEKGQTVLVEGSGAAAWTDSVFWRNRNDATNNADTKFDDLHYRDDDY